MEIWQALLLGLIEGITEYLPVSSTGHLIIASALMGLDQTPVQKSAVDTFNIVIQGGAILAVLGLYRTRVSQMLRGLLGKDAAGLQLAIQLGVAFVPAAVLGVLLDDLISAKLFYAVPVLIALFLGGILMIVLDRTHIRPNRPRRRPLVGLEDMTLGQAIVIGLLQCVAMVPGTSRSMMTIAGGVIAGLRPKDAAEFSFLLGLPTLGGACVYKLAKNLRHASETGTPNLFEALGWVPVIIGLAVATVSAAFAIRWLVTFLTRHGLSVFGVYRIVLAIVLGSLVWSGMVSITPESAVPPEELSLPLDATGVDQSPPDRPSPDRALP